MKGVEVTFQDVIGDSFRPNITDYNFIYQKKFKLESIMVILVKDFICACFIIVMFQYINLNFLHLFSSATFADTPYEEQ